MRFYMAHPFDERLNVREQQLKLQQAFPQHEFIDPFYDCDPFPIIGEIDGGKCDRWDRWAVDFELIINHDLELIRQSDAVIAFVKGPCYGTIFEVVNAALVFRLPVIIVVEPPYHNHPWLAYYATDIFQSWDSLIAAWKEADANTG